MLEEYDVVSDGHIWRVVKYQNAIHLYRDGNLVLHTEHFDITGIISTKICPCERHIEDVYMTQK